MLESNPLKSRILVQYGDWPYTTGATNEAYSSATRRHTLKWPAFVSIASFNARVGRSALSMCVRYAYGVHAWMQTHLYIHA